MTSYYNEIEPYAAQWLRNLIAAGHIAPGEVDERSIADVQPDDLRGFTQCHFFAGIGGWSYALRLAAWPDERPVWTGSCPCQPFSAAGKRKGQSDERHLWPEFKRLIAACRPKTVFGEQVASSEVVGTELEASFLVAVQAGEYARANKLAKRLVASKGFHYHKRWLDAVQTDMAEESYTVRPIVLGAHSVGAPHLRQRLYWVADADARPERLEPRGGGRMGERGAQHNSQSGSGGCGEVGGMADALPAGWSEGRAESRNGPTSECRESGGLGNTDDTRLEGRRDQFGERSGELAARATSPWRDIEWLACSDGKARPTQPGLFPLAHGVPARVGRLRAYGNAIVPQVAAAFIQTL